MTLNKIQKLLKARRLWADAKKTDVQIAKASDLMSDVLTFSGPGKLLLTGLTNTHTIRTCDIAGIQIVVFVRGKTPQRDAIKLGRKYKITMLATELSMFEACGVLYHHGIRGVRIIQVDSASKHGT